jgi:septal ring factor EnvC (AmiA/AmiB activator)
MSENEAVAEDTTPADVTTRSVAEHLNSLLLSADTAAQRIVQEAEARAQGQLAEVEQRIRLMEAETAKLAGWRREMEEMVSALASALGEFARDVEGIPQRIDEALAPLATHVPLLAGQIDELRGALGAEQPAGDYPQSSEAAMYREQAEDHIEPGRVEAGWAAGWADLDDETG